jgi:iron(III) transport system ATP-binding protein
VRVQYGDIVALDGVSLEVASGEIVSLLGPSGSGKSTLLRLVAGVDAPTSGRISIDGAEVAGPTAFIEPERRRVGMVFQDFALFPHLTVADNIAFGLHGRQRADARPLVDAMLDRLGLRRFASSYPHTLSGGERQRVALARALAPGPRVLLMDEPFSSLDARLRDDVRRFTLDVLRESATTTVIVTHDPEEAMAAGDRMALLSAGRLVQYGTPSDVYSNPVSLSAARVLGHVNVIPGVCARGRIETPLGSFPASHIPEGSSACVCIRPEHLRIAAHPALVHARVVDLSFLGAIDSLQVAITGLDTPLTLRASGRTGLRRGDRTAIDVATGHALVLPSANDAPVRAADIPAER